MAMSRPDSTAPASHDRFSLGGRLRELRRARGHTLAEVSRRSGLAISTISKVERGQLALAYDKFIALARGLELDVATLFDQPADHFSTGALALTRAADAPEHETETYLYRMLATALTAKRMVPMFGRIKAHDRKSFTDYVRHRGEEFLFVLQGQLDVHIEGRRPIRLGPHDSLYFDSGMGHVYVSAGRQDAQILVVCAGGDEANLLAAVGPGTGKKTRRKPSTPANRRKRT